MTVDFPGRNNKQTCGIQITGITPGTSLLSHLSYYHCLCIGRLSNNINMHDLHFGKSLVEC